MGNPNDVAVLLGERTITFDELMDATEYHPDYSQYVVTLDGEPYTFEDTADIVPAVEGLGWVVLD